MPLTKSVEQVISPDLIDAVESFSLQRDVRHCGEVFQVSPFSIYAACPVCNARIKVRAFSGTTELEDVFDAVFTWMSQPGARELVQQRQHEIAANAD